MTGLSHICNGDYRNEGWGLIGAIQAWLCWNNDDDNKYDETRRRLSQLSRH